MWARLMGDFLPACAPKFMKDYRLERFNGLAPVALAGIYCDRYGLSTVEVVSFISSMALISKSLIYCIKLFLLRSTIFDYLCFSKVK